MTMSFQLSVRAAALLLVWLPLAPAAAQFERGDEGSFRISVDGRVVGTEEFSIRHSGSGSTAEVVATGRVTLDLLSGRLELVPRLRAVGVGADPSSYEVSVGGDAQLRIVGSVGAGRFSAKIASPTGEQLREYVASRGAVILDDGVAHHYYFLARRLRDGQVPILIPRENRQVLARVTSQGEETLEIGGRSGRFYRITVHPVGGEPRYVWVDALNRVVRVEIPSRGYLAVRTELPG
jgi:hypothetical protein